MYEGKVFRGVRLDGKKGKHSVKVTMWDGTIETFEFDHKQDAKEARIRAQNAGCHAKLV